MLPPSKYPSGPGVVETLRQRRRNSCPDLAALSARAAAEAEQQQSAHAPLLGGGGGGGGQARRPGSRRRSLEGVAGAVHHCSSLPRLDGWKEDEQVRRRSIAVGQVRLQPPLLPAGWLGACGWVVVGWAHRQVARWWLLVGWLSGAGVVSHALARCPAACVSREALLPSC